MVQFRKLTALLCTVCLLLTCFAGLQVSADRVPGQYTGKLAGMGLNEDGYFQISRELAKCEPMGGENTWTIFVYLCGSDLESTDGSATLDLQEMIDGSKDSAVRYVVMTGGCLQWQNELVNSGYLEIYLIQNGTIQLVSRDSYNYMNDPITLYAFLKWGVANYPADKMGMVIWDHGGGCINGVCKDSWFFYDIMTGELEDTTGYSYMLTLPLIDAALGKVYEEMTDQFEFIGFDACLMGTVETAFMLSSYARYMYASEEIEPGFGWDYTAIGQAIGRTGEIDGAGLGKVVCDSYYDSCAAVNQAGTATLSCIDLSKMDDLALQFDMFAANMLYIAQEPSALAAIMQNMRRVEFYGNNSKEEGYHNLVDLAGLIDAAAPITGGAEAVLSALDQAVVYRRNGIYHRGSGGLSVYYPHHVESGTGELGRFAQVACSPYYYGYVAQNAYAASYGTISGYDPIYSLRVWYSTVTPGEETIIEDYGPAQVTGQSPRVVFYDVPQLLEDGSYGFSLTDESLPYITLVTGNIYSISPDGEDVILLGSTTDIRCDWEQGIFLDNFDGLWFCLPDEQLISAFLVSGTPDYAMYTTPVLLNGEQTNLRFVVTPDYTVTLTGVWSGTDEYGLAGRNTYQLQVGDVIQPLLQAINREDGTDVFYYGHEYVYDGSNTWYYNHLPDATYYYLFSIHDIYGDYYNTDPVTFNIADGTIYFNLE